MSAYRLQTFAPDAGGAAPRVSPRERELAALREAAYGEGFLAGQAAATEAFLDDQTRLTSEFVEALNDARMTNEAARRHVAASLAPVAAALCEALIPALAAAGLAEEVAAHVARALAAAPEARPRLRCAPEIAVSIRGLLAERGLQASVEAAPELLPREAVLHWDQGFDRIDLDACAADLQAVVATHLDPLSDQPAEAERRYG